MYEAAHTEHDNDQTLEAAEGAFGEVRQAILGAPIVTIRERSSEDT